MKARVSSLMLIISLKDWLKRSEKKPENKQTIT